MARVRDVTPEEVPDDLRALYARFSGELGPFRNQAAVIAHRPPALRHVMGLLAEFADEARIPKRILEIALVAVSKLNQCRYCVAHHAPKLAETGLAPETIAAILDADCPGLDATERLVRDYAVQVTTRAGALDDELFAALRGRFDEAEMVELTLRIALCSFFNRFNDALRIEIEDDAMAALMASGLDADALPAAGTAA
jgi:uncharacterized peroxidase-related enzyme